MAKKDKMNLQNASTLRDKSAAIVYGTTEALSDENETLQNIIQKTINDTKEMIGERTNSKPINYFNDINFGRAFNEFFVDNKKNKDESNKRFKDANEFKKYMEEAGQSSFAGLQSEDATRSMIFNNYRIIHKHIPECAQALSIYKDNIMSPDDFTKLIFNITYEKAIGEEAKKTVLDRCEDLTVKYEIEDNANKIIDETLELGESYVAVLSLEDELNNMLSDEIYKGNKFLHEQVVRLDENAKDITVLSENVEINEDTLGILNEYYHSLDAEGNEINLDEDTGRRLVASLINNNVVIGSSKELLIERLEAEFDKNKSLNLFHGKTEKKKRKKVDDDDPMYLNGSVVRYLVPERIVELKIDNVCYGYFYAEEVNTNKIANQTYLGTASGRAANGVMNLAANNTISGTSIGSYVPQSGAASQLGVGEQKLKIIADLFLTEISKKVDKQFVRDNREFKDFIYDLVRQDFIIKKGMKLTYFRPDEVIKFECDSVYKDIVFFAKLYLAILTNNVLIKMGRAHDKRVFYINVGVDANYEQAVQSVIEDIKTKDYKMENLNDFNTLLNLAPGRFDDYFMPTINGERPVEIDTLAGMDTEMNNEFIEYLKNSMMSGMGVPRNLIDVTSEVDYARSISAMNSNFVRSVIRYQKKLTLPFTRLYQKLYQNEYRFNEDQELDSKGEIDISAIRVQFPSPATLAMSSISDQITVVDQNADFITNQLLPMNPNGTNETERAMLKTEIVKDLLPVIDWDRYEEMLENIKIKKAKKTIEDKGTSEEGMDNPMAGAMTGMDPYGPETY